MSDDAKSLVAAQEQLAADRSNLDTWWDAIASRVMPAQRTFTESNDEGVPKTERLFSGKPGIACERFAAVLDELMTPRTQEWHGLEPEDPELAQSHDCKVYLERLTKLLFAKRYSPRANFAPQRNQGYLSVGAFGNSNMFIDEAVGFGPRYIHVPLKESYWALNHVGRIDTMYRRYELKPKQAVQQAAELKWKLPPDVAKAYETGSSQTFEFIHCVKPNDDRKAGRMDAAGMPWSSYYLCLADKERILSNGGFRTWPFATGRYMVHGRNVYGHSPAMAAWPSILTLNEEKKTILRAGQKIVDPPVLLGEDGALEPFSLRSSALNHGMLGPNGEPLAKAFETKGNIQLGMELMGIEQADIEEAFLVSVLRILTDPRMTAAQVYELTAQKATILAPTATRLETEDLGALIEREIDILAQDTANAWILTEMPDELREAGGAYKIVYKSPLARAMRAKDGVAILRTLEIVPQAAAIDPTAAEIVDVPAAIRELADINGAPAKILRSEKEAAARIEQRQQQMAAMAAAQAAEPASQAALNVARAEQARTAA